MSTSVTYYWDKVFTGSSELCVPSRKACGRGARFGFDLYRDVPNAPGDSSREAPRDVEALKLSDV